RQSPEDRAAQAPRTSHPLIRGSRAQRAGGLGFQRFFNTLTDGLELLQHLKIGEANDANALRRKRISSPLVISFRRGREVTVAVQFDDEHFTGTVEVGDVLAHGLLARKFPR